MKLYRIPVSILFLCVFLQTAFSADAGLLLDQTLETGNSADDLSFDYTGKLIPWVSAPLRKNFDFYVSAGGTAKNADSDWTFIPELFRASLRFRFGSSQIEAGRIRYADPLGFIAAGNFDGLAFETGLGTGIFSAGAYYTGFLYKRAANIAMTAKELTNYNSPLDWEDFGGTYFSPRRVLAHVSYSDSFAGRLRLKLALLGEFDASGEEYLYHSQYLTARLSFPWKIIIIEGGGVMELIEAAETDPKPAFAGELGLFLMPPGGIMDRVYLGGRWSSGRQEDDSIAAFTPFTTVSQGKILKAPLSGLTSITAAYNARLHQKLALEVEGQYFLRTDLGTYSAWPVQDRDSYLLGFEAFTRLTYSPVSDLRLNLGGGAFIPAPEHKTGIRWQIQFNVLLALF